MARLKKQQSSGRASGDKASRGGADVGRRKTDPELVFEAERPDVPLRRRAYDGVGHQLKLARQRADLSLERVMNELNIREALLTALEEGRFDDLPERTYVTGFIRAYAGLLGLDVERMLQLYREEDAANLGARRLSFPTPEPEARLPTMGLVMVSVLVMALLFGGWYYLEMGSQEEGAGDIVPAVPDRLARLLERDDGPAATDSSEAGATGNPIGSAEPGVVGDGATASIGGDPSVPAEEGPQAMMPQTASQTAESSSGEAEPQRLLDNPDSIERTSTLDGGATAGSTASEDEDTDAAGTKTEAGDGDQGIAESASSADSVPPQAALQEPEALRAQDDTEAVAERPAPPSLADVDAGVRSDYVPNVFGIGNTDARVVIVAQRESWVQVRGEGDELLLTRVLNPGDSYFVPDRAGLTLMTGDAGGLEIRVDGEPIGPIGPSGKVVRDLPLEPDRLLARFPRGG